MFKNLVRLVALITVIIVVFVFSIESMLNVLLLMINDGHNDEDLTHVPFYFIQYELNKKPQSKWQETIKTLQKNYDYPLDLININDLKLEIKQKKKLIETSLLTTEKVENNFYEEIWYATLPESSLVIRMYRTDTITNNNDKAFKGIFKSINQFMNEHTEQEWQQQFKLFNEKYGLLIERVLIKDITLNKYLFSILQQGKVVVTNKDDPTSVFYYKINETDSVLQIRPFSNLSSDNFIVKNIEPILVSILVILIIIGLYLWMRPIWRDLKILNSVTTNFGDGDFQSRSTITKKSAIWQLSTTFNKMATRISKLITSHKDLTRAVSHELRTPLARLRFAIDMLNEETDETLKQDFIDSMGIDVDELELLISELLMYAKFERENPELHYTELDITIWLEKLIEKIQFEQITINLQFVNLMKDKTVLVEFDPKQIDRALNNLIRNAIRYAKNRVDVCLSIVDDYCCIAIDDDGPGIPETERERILQPFTRIDSSRNRKTGGYGLGLSIVQQIIKWHNGNISITTSRYNGASFKLMLPFKNTNG
ncbi:MAG: ATP-binding protein [Thiohalomonadales bacterium]